MSLRILFRAFSSFFLFFSISFSALRCCLAESSSFSSRVSFSSAGISTAGFAAMLLILCCFWASRTRFSSSVNSDALISFKTVGSISFSLLTTIILALDILGDEKVNERGSLLRASSRYLIRYAFFSSTFMFFNSSSAYYHFVVKQPVDFCIHGNLF